MPALDKPIKKKNCKTRVFQGRLIFIIGLFFVFGFLADLSSAFTLGTFINLIIFAFVSFFGYYKIREGKTLEKRLVRYYRYMKVLETRKYASLEELGAMVAKQEKTVRRDLEYMMDKGWFLEGHFDAGKEQFILTDEVFEHYKAAERGRLMREKEERKTEGYKKEKTEDRYSSGADNKSAADGHNRKEDNLDREEELEKILKEGKDYIKKIHKLNDVILGDYISSQMDDIEKNLISIFEILKRKPEKIDDIKKLMQYYLPMTVKILSRYSDFESEKIHSKKLEEGKREIEETLEKVKQAFKNLRERLYQEDILDVSTDLDVLEAMMAQEGLLDDSLTF